MNVPESWLRAFCNPAIPGRQLADRLTMAGLEVEAYEPFGPQFSGVVVGEDRLASSAPERRQAHGLQGRRRQDERCRSSAARRMCAPA